MFSRPRGGRHPEVGANGFGLCRPPYLRRSRLKEGFVLESVAPEVSDGVSPGPRRATLVFPGQTPVFPRVCLPSSPLLVSGTSTFTTTTLASSVGDRPFVNTHRPSVIRGPELRVGMGSFSPHTISDVSLNLNVRSKTRLYETRQSNRRVIVTRPPTHPPTRVWGVYYK